MMFPLVLTSEELFCLRMMIRTVMGRRIFEVATQFKNDRESADPGRFMSKVLSVHDVLRDLDAPLFLAELEQKKKPGTAVVSVPENVFNTLKSYILPAKFYPQPGHTEALTQRICDAQPPLRAAFEVAEDAARRVVTVNVPAATAVN